MMLVFQYTSVDVIIKFFFCCKSFTSHIHIGL